MMQSEATGGHVVWTGESWSAAHPQVRWQCCQGKLHQLDLAGNILLPSSVLRHLITTIQFEALLSLGQLLWSTLHVWDFCGCERLQDMWTLTSCASQNVHR